MDSVFRLPLISRLFVYIYIYIDRVRKIKLSKSFLPKKQDEITGEIRPHFTLQSTMNENDVENIPHLYFNLFHFNLQNFALNLPAQSAPHKRIIPDNSDK